MGKKYANSPIIETVCEFRLPPDSKWDLTIPGLVYEKICDEFPNKEQRLIKEIDLKHGPQGVEQQIRTNERILFLTEDRKTFIQVGTHLLAVNCLKPYPTWNKFKPSIEKAFKALSETIVINTFQRIGLRYINRIEIPGQSVKLEDYFEFRPFLGKDLPQNMADFIVGGVLQFHDGRDSCRVQLSKAVPEKPNNVSFLLDFDFFLAKSQTVSIKQALEWIDNAHQEVEKIFEGCINERLREIFQELK